MIGIACDRCGSQNTTLKNEATFNFCYDRAGCDARRKTSPDHFRNEDVIAPIEGHPSVRLHGPRDACNALLEREDLKKALELIRDGDFVCATDAETIAGDALKALQRSTQAKEKEKP